LHRGAGSRSGAAAIRNEREHRMANEISGSGSFYGRFPYVEGFDIGYPQENLEGEMYKYRCRCCKKLTTEINGKLENHAEDCEYRRARMKSVQPLKD
jgi:hypothetical protein